jgi:predicted XRE-type DNA-binding protein
MAKKFRDLVTATLSREQQAEAHAEAQVMLAEMNLREIREHLSTFSQDDLAKLLHVTQPYVSKLERQPDMLISKLYEFVAMLGGAIEIHARFPERDVVVTQFDDLAQVFEAKPTAHNKTRAPAQKRRQPAQQRASGLEARSSKSDANVLQVRDSAVAPPYRPGSSKSRRSNKAAGSKTKTSKAASRMKTSGGIRRTA